MSVPSGLAHDVLAASRVRSGAEAAPGGRHAFEGCVERLATAIRLGVYPCGSSLPPERELALLLGVSRATVREAIAALRQAGMVRTTRGRGGGTVVDLEPPTPGTEARVGASRRPELMDALVFRRVVEPGACHVAASRRREFQERQRVEPSGGCGGSSPHTTDGFHERQRVEPSGGCGGSSPHTTDGFHERQRVEPSGGCGGSSPHMTERVGALHAAHERVRAARSPAEHRQADSRLHLAIAGMTGSAYLLDAVTQVQAAVHEMLLAIPVLGVNIEHSNAQHAEIVAAIEAGEPERARRAMEEHCDDTAALVRGLLR